MFVFGLLIVAGCATEEPACESVPAVVNEDGTTSAIVTPAQLYTGTNGRDLYRAVVVTNFGELSFASSNEQVATVEPFGCLIPGTFDITGIVTARGEGQTTITVNSDQFSRDIPVTVSGYSLAEYELGQRRYENPDNPSPARRGCAECHSEAGGAPHDPLALAGFSDEDLIAATRLGKYPDKCVQPSGLTCNCTPSGTDSQTACNACAGDCRFSEGITLDNDRTNQEPDPHIWDLTVAEEQGIMAYMRAIPPRGV